MHERRHGDRPLLDSASYAAYFFMPYIGVIGSEAETGPTTQRLYDQAQEPKELVAMPGH